MQLCRVFAQKVLAQVAHCLKHILPGPYLITKSFHRNIVGFFQWGALILTFFLHNYAFLGPKAKNMACLFSLQHLKKTFWARFSSFPRA
jgi:hypothetical protein